MPLALLRYRMGRLTLVVTGLFALCGSNCELWRGFGWAPHGPQMLPPKPGINDIVAAVNRNNGQVRSFFSNTATISVPGAPTLRANIAYLRPRCFRLRAETAVFGEEIDVGSNDQIFWFWIRRSRSPAVYYCRHDEFAASRVKQMIPVDPNWIFEALGTATLDTSLPLQGPDPAPGNRLQVRTIRDTPQGQVTKITVIDATTAWVMEQHIYLNGQLEASSFTDGYSRDPMTGLYVPNAIRVESPPTKFSMRIDLGKLKVNTLSGAEAQLWTPPVRNEAPPVNLADPNLVLPGAPATAAQPGPYGAQPMMRRY
jgi:hypothetical protein